MVCFRYTTVKKLPKVGIKYYNDDNNNTERY